MNRNDITTAYIIIRRTNNSIPDEVLDFMKDAAINALTVKEGPDQNLFNTLHDLFGVTALVSEMDEIKRAILKDK